MSVPTPYELKDTILQIEHVSLDLGGTTILRDVNAEVKDIVRPGCTQGQVVGLLGPSGIGKTKLFDILSGTLKPTVGRVLMTAKAVPVKMGSVGVVAQDYPLFEHRKVIGNLMVAGRQAGLTEDQARAKAKKLLEVFMLKSKEDSYPASLSGGQRQRVAIAQQLMCSEHFLLMDEPFTGLDPIMKDQACKMITDLASADELNTILVVTHELSAAVMVADTLWMMGRDHDAKGDIIPGARVVSTIDLIAKGLAWQPNVASLPAFADVVRELRELFPSL
jgi:polar amino acid transport system ATP-binding protein/sulfate transport system ATP-binding protein